MSRVPDKDKLKATNPSQWETGAGTEVKTAFLISCMNSGNLHIQDRSLLTIYFKIQTIKEEFNCILQFVNILFYSTKKKIKKLKPADCSQKYLTLKIKHMLHLLCILIYISMTYLTYTNLFHIFDQGIRLKCSECYDIFTSRKKWRNGRHGYMALRKIAHSHLCYIKE